MKEIFLIVILTISIFFCVVIAFVMICGRKQLQAEEAARQDSEPSTDVSNDIEKQKSEAIDNERDRILKQLEQVLVKDKFDVSRKKSNERHEADME